MLFHPGRRVPQSWFLRAALAEPVQARDTALDKPVSGGDGHAILEAAKALHASMTAVRAGNMTPNECRAALRALRAEIGDDAYSLAKICAMANSTRADWGQRTPEVRANALSAAQARVARHADERAQRDQLVRDAIAAGWTHNQIADVTGLTCQRIDEIARRQGTGFE